MGYKGHVRAPNKDHLIDVKYAHHGAALRYLYSLKDVPPVWDSRAKGWIGPVKDQGQCGSCWCYSGTCVCEVAYYVAGKPGEPFSEQYTLSCGKNGGCSGDDNVTVLDWAKTTGLPNTTDYGPYEARAEQCKWSPSMTLYKIDEWGFADSNGGNGVTPTPDIQQAIMRYGAVGAGVAAGGDSFWDSGQGVGTGKSDQIDHDVVIVGWRPSGSTRVSALIGSSHVLRIRAATVSEVDWIMRNSWNTSWGDKCANDANPNPVEAGYAWVREGAYSLGTEAVWAKVGSAPPPPPIDWNI